MEPEDRKEPMDAEQQGMVKAFEMMDWIERNKPKLGTIPVYNASAIDPQMRHIKDLAENGLYEIERMNFHNARECLLAILWACPREDGTWPSVLGKASGPIEVWDFPL